MQETPEVWHGRRSPLAYFAAVREAGRSRRKLTSDSRAMWHRQILLGLRALRAVKVGCSGAPTSVRDSS